MDHSTRSIIEDLLPLYQEGLLREETAQWLEARLKENPDYEQLAALSRQELPQPDLKPPNNYDQMMKAIQRKLSVYQLIFVAISFYLAIRTSLLNDSFGFILWYTVLGTVTYLFYRDGRMVALISFLPVLLWSIGSALADYSGLTDPPSIGAFAAQSVLGAALLALLHGLFAIIGALIGWLLLKLKDKGESP